MRSEFSALLRGEPKQSTFDRSHPVVYCNNIIPGNNTIYIYIDIYIYIYIYICIDYY